MKKFFSICDDFITYRPRELFCIFLVLAEVFLFTFIFENIPDLGLCVTNEIGLEVYALLFIFISPWIVVYIYSGLDSNKYHKLWINKNNIELILKSINSEVKVSSVIDDYECFIIPEIRHQSLVAKYFIKDSDYEDEKKYRYAVKGYSLSYFCKQYSLICYCMKLEYAFNSTIFNLFSSKISNRTDNIIRLASYVYGTDILHYVSRYYCNNRSSIVRTDHLSDILAEYIHFTVYKKHEISLECFILFAADYCHHTNKTEYAEEFRNYCNLFIHSSDKENYYKINDFEEIGLFS